MTPFLAAIVALTNTCGVVTVDTHGARVVSYVPKGGSEVFFVSDTGTGGMPLCWPWFGGQGPREDSARHGIARYRDFKVVGTTRATSDDTTLTLRLESDEDTRRLFPHDFLLTVTVRLNDRLTVTMTGTNTGSDPFEVTEAFHPYFAVGDSEKCRLEGENAAEYTLEDPVLGRTLAFADGPASCGRRMWRPHAESHLSKTVSPIAANDWKRFVCVENGTFDKGAAYVLKPGKSHTLSRTIWLASAHGNANSSQPQDYRFLGQDAQYASWDAFYKRLYSLDAAADEAWTGISSIADFDVRCDALRKKMIERIGGFPERTPLNAKVTGILRCDGYRVEKVLFESRPGMYITANLYLPDEARFHPPYPASIELCGHSDNGKHAQKYQRLASMAAKNGVAALVVDPLGQGERRQSPEDDAGSPVVNHLRMGVNATLLGCNLAAFEIWDAIRALDYLGTRTDIRHDGYGAMGNSGGGTQSVMLSALDSRIKATATSCYLSNLREQTRWRLLADCEQLIFGQLADGINHVAYPLLGGNPVLMLGRSNDMIPFSGTLATARLLQGVGRNIGRTEWYDFFSSPGPHGYNEQLMRQTINFLVRRLRGDTATFDEPEFDTTKQDFGPDERDAWVVPGGCVQSLDGFKSFYDCLNNELDAALAARGSMTRLERARMVRTAADIDEGRVGARTVVSESTLADGTKVMRALYDVSDGYKMPVVEIVPPDTKQRHPPLVLAIDGPRTNCAELVRTYGKRAIFIPDLCACGEIGAARHHYFCPYDDEETAKMIYLMGGSLVGRRAGELIVLGKEAKRRLGKNPTVMTTGRLAVAAAHAIAAEPGLFVDHKFFDPPLSWTQAIRSRAQSLYSTSVHGALRQYDWVDLCE